MYETKRVRRRLLMLWLIVRCALCCEKYGIYKMLRYQREKIFLQPVDKTIKAN